MLLRALLAATALAASISCASAQTFTLPEIGLQTGGGCPQIAVRERTGKTMVPLGCVDNSAKTIRWTGDGSGISVAPTISAASGTLSRLLANRAPITDDGSVPAAGLNARSTGQGLIPYKPVWAQTPGPERLRYQNLMELKTSRDGDAWESALGIEFISETGYATNWSAGAVVKTGDNIVATPSGAGEAYTYRVLQAGTLGSSAAGWGGPNSAPFTDGSAQLQWINYANLAAKIAFTNTIVMRGEAGTTWGNNDNFIIDKINHKPGFVTGREIDFSNQSDYHCDLFTGSTCNAITMFLGGSKRVTSGFTMGVLHDTGTPVSEWGIYLAGKLARDAVIEVNTTGGAVGIGFGRHAGLISPAEFSAATILDESTSPDSIRISGKHAGAGISFLNGNATDTPYAIKLALGQRICFDGTASCMYKDGNLGRLVYEFNGVRMFSIDDNGFVRSKSGFATEAP